MKLYHLGRNLIGQAFNVYFKKIDYSGFENVPVGKPMLFSCNHPTGFFEPCLLACLTDDMEYHFITRGDVFKKPFYRMLLEGLNMIPIFRFKDGFANLKNNAVLMENIFKLLSEKKSIIIFTEGSTITVKRLRPLQKGLARMAFGSFDAYGDIDLHIVPVGISYTEPHRFRSEAAMVQFGEAIPLSKYYELYQQNNIKGVNQLTNDLKDVMRPLIIEIEKPENDEVSENIMTIYRNSFPEPVFPIRQKSKRRLMAHQEIANRINALDENQLNALKTRTENYFTSLKKLGLDDLAIAQPWHANFKNTLTLVIGFIPFAIGWLGHYFIGWYAEKTKREKVKYLEFEGPVFAGTALGVTIVQYLVLILLAFIINRWAFYGFVFFLPFLGIYSILYRDMWQKYRLCNALKVKNTENTEGGVLALQKEREAILKTVYR
jgi:glycerol-3-phosphate O-acyltransferase / dihydroxyacetone phosphate acyltransferase